MLLRFYVQLRTLFFLSVACNVTALCVTHQCIRNNGAAFLHRGRRHCRCTATVWACKKWTNQEPPCCPIIPGFSFHLCSSTRALGLQGGGGETTCAELAGGKLIIVKHFHPWPFESVSSLPAILLWAEKHLQPCKDRRAGGRIDCLHPTEGED